jgi:hypothetical protein
MPICNNVIPCFGHPRQPPPPPSPPFTQRNLSSNSYSRIQMENPLVSVSVGEQAQVNTDIKTPLMT